MERSVRTLRSLFEDLATEHPGRSWVNMLGDVAKAYNTRMHSGGVCVPFEVFFGRPFSRTIQPSTSIEAFEAKVTSKPNDEDEHEKSMNSPVRWWNHIRKEDYGLQKHLRKLRGTRSSAVSALAGSLLDAVLADD